MNLLSIIEQSPEARKIAERLRADRSVAARGSHGSSTALLAGALSRLVERPVLLVVAHLDDADEAVEDLRAAGASALRFPALELVPGETGASADLLAERLETLRAVGSGEGGASLVIAAPIQALMQPVPAPDRRDEYILDLTTGDARGPQALARWLEAAGYRRLDAIDEPGHFAVRGGIVDIFPPGDGSDGVGVPVRLDYFGDELERISEIDLDTMGSDRAVPSVRLVRAEITTEQLGRQRPLDLLPDSVVPLLHEVLELTEQARGYFERVTDGSLGIAGPPTVFKTLRERFRAHAEVGQVASGTTGAPVEVDLPVSPLPALAREAGQAMAELAELTQTSRLAVLCQNPGEQQRLRELLAEHAPEAQTRIVSGVQYLHRGFVWGEGPSSSTLVPYHELMHRFDPRRRTRRMRGGRAADTFLDLTIGDYVVHAEHGIAQFTGLVRMKPHQARRGPARTLEEVQRGSAPEGGAAEAEEEFLSLEFAGSSKLHVPASQIGLVQKYIGGFQGKPPLSTLGGTRWRHQKERAAESVRDLAGELLRIRAAREHLPGVRFPADTAWQREFEDEFPYEETEDQVAALAEIKRDMQHDRPMDRLVCGDVGFGKTELAIRAAFKACEFGKQVAVLVPTTVLAEQHERTFRSRFADYPFRVESLSRMKTTSEVNDTLAALRRGAIDVIIGTHRLLSKDVRFADLGLVIVDEEQRFGVEHKERLLSLRMTVDVLTLSATPIPRTLHMAMLGLRDISSLATPPADRRAVVTEVLPYSERKVRQAIERELAREGQIYYVHNRVHDIQSVADGVAALAPGARVVYGHGQMQPRELERVMLQFMRRDADVLVCTTIIESGIDIPTANTMIIADADRFGLADLHQLRGRVGRYKHRAYCYLLLPENRPVKEKAKRRLKAIEEFSMLGAGFKIAMRDLEIRGAGNILGPDQSGHIAAVGYDMYCQLLEQAVRELKGEARPTPPIVSIEIGLTGVIPKAYIPSDQRRLEAYRRFATASTAGEIARARSDLTQAYGSPPKQVERLIGLAELRVAAGGLGVRTLTVREKDVVFRTGDVQAVVGALQGAEGTVTPLAPRPGEEYAEVYYRPPAAYLEPETLLAVLRRRLCGGAPERRDEVAKGSGVKPAAAPVPGVRKPPPPPRPPASPGRTTRGPR